MCTDSEEIMVLGTNEIKGTDSGCSNWCYVVLSIKDSLASGPAHPTTFLLGQVVLFS